VLAAAVALVCGAAAAGIVIVSQTSYKDQRAITNSDLVPSFEEPSKSDSGFAVCLTGFLGAQNVSASLRKFVIDPLRADLFVVSPESRTSLQAFEPFEGNVGRDIDLLPYFDNITGNNWRSVLEIDGHWFYNASYQWISLMQCNDLIKAAEASRGQRYKGIVLSRLDFMWLQPHPDPVQERNAGCWIPCPGNDFGGFCDHHASCDRNSAEVYMTGRVASIVDPVLRGRLLQVGQVQQALRSYYHPYKPNDWDKQWQAKFSAEMYLKFVLDHFLVPVNRSVVAAFRSCIPGSRYNRHGCMYVDAFKMWGKSSGLELMDCMNIFVA
jgi:hypothetical protein